MGTAHHPPESDLAGLLRQLRKLPPGARAAVQRLLDGGDPQQARDRFLPFVLACACCCTFAIRSSGPTFVPLAAPQETDDGCAAAAIEQLKASWQLEPPG